jgi:hypothetical protein
MDAVTRAWSSFVALLADLVGSVSILALLSLLAATLVALGWYFWPWRLPLRRGSGGGSRRGERGIGYRGRFRLGRVRWRLRWRRKRRGEQTDEPVEQSDDLVPDVPAATLALSADQLAAAGRYKEAVRERLRAILRDLIERGILPPSPGWTVMELAAAAGRTRPALAVPMAGAAGVFSEIWYGLRPATAADDAAMRGHATAIAAAVATSAGRNGESQQTVRASTS